jgi:nitric oxide reductase NorE protein
MTGRSARPERHLPGEPGIWVFILGDLVVFGIFFVTFAVYREANLATYAASHHALNQAFGLINTLLLLTSSWFVASAVKAVRAGDRARAGPFLAAGLLLGTGFCGMKALEWGEKFRAGVSLLTDDFFMFYFMYTGIHLLHVAIGMVVLVGMIAIARRPEPTARDLALLEGGGVFWHLVDLLWIVIFALFYLVS